MNYIFILTLLIFCFASFSQTSNKNIRYEYKKFERFDFEEIGVEGESGVPGDISVSSRLRTEFKNKLPERKNFNKEMVSGVNAVR